MQMCPNCNRVYDESEYTRCPYCHPRNNSGIRLLFTRDKEKKSGGKSKSSKE